MPKMTQTCFNMAKEFSNSLSMNYEQKKKVVNNLD